MSDVNASVITNIYQRLQYNMLTPIIIHCTMNVICEATLFFEFVRSILNDFSLRSNKTMPVYFQYVELIVISLAYCEEITAGMT